MKARGLNKLGAIAAQRPGHARISPAKADGADVPVLPVHPGGPEVPAAPFASRLLRWFRRHGRKDLPWQADKTPYKVWVSEVMLQQTQVQSVIPYFLRFMEHFPTVRELAESEPEHVISLWSGLGYYARAHNLRRAAKAICERHNGEMPDTLDELTALPGIGRSTAGAILALCCRRREPILDGNVKRVLARHRGVAGWPGRTDVAKRLWEWSRDLLPARRDSMANYTQALMDLGATVCVRRRPRCEACPVADGCYARLNDRIQAFPAPRPKVHRPVRRTTMIVATRRGRVLMTRRPDAGLWAGLLSLPEVDGATTARAWCRRTLGIDAQRGGGGEVRWDEVRHGFTHFQLRITPVVIRVETRPQYCREADGLVWCRIEDGLKQAPAPVKKLLQRLDRQEWQK